jgi:hypothetical protein
MPANVSRIETPNGPPPQRIKISYVGAWPDEELTTLAGAE